MSPTALSMRLLRRQGYLVDVVERRLPHTFITKDLFSCIDLCAITIDEPVLGVQCTSLSNVSARVAKARASPQLAVWLGTGHARFQVHGWAKRAGKWAVKIVELSGPDMEAEVLSRPPRRGKRLTQRELWG